MALQFLSTDGNAEPGCRLAPADGRQQREYAPDNHPASLLRPLQPTVASTVPEAHPKMSVGTMADTNTLGTSTIWLIRRSTATLHSAYAC